MPKQRNVSETAQPDDLAAALRRQEAYRQRRSTRFGRGAERLTAPLGETLGRIVPPEAMRAALRAADGLAGLTLGAALAHDVDDLAACEVAARRVQAWAAGSNAASGAAAGWFGAAGVTADIPTTITLAARNVRATGLAYGFAGTDAEETAFRLMILELATSQGDAGRSEALGNLNRLAAFLSSPEGRIVMEKGGDWLTEKVVERVARQLGLTLAGRKAGQVVPIVGSAVASVVNASFQTDVARAARYGYRQRWLMARRLLPNADPA